MIAKRLLLIVILGLIVRLMYLDVASLSLDEGYTILSARRPLTEILEQGPCDANPVLSDLIFHFGAGQSGSIEHLRIVSVFFAVLSLVALWKMGAILFDAQTGLIAALLLAVSSYHVVYSQFLRIYSVTFFLCLLAAYFFVVYRERNFPKDRWCLYIAAILLVNAHAFGFFVLAGLAVYDLLSKKVAFSTVVRDWVAVFALCLPTAYWVLSTHMGARGFAWLEAPSWNTFFSIWSAIAGDNLILLVVFASSAIFGMRRARKHKMERGALLLLVCLTMVPLILAAIVSFTTHSIFHVRYFFIIAPPFLLLVAYGISQLPAAGLRAVVLIAIVCMSSQNMYRYFCERAAARTERQWSTYITDNFKAGDAVLHQTKCSFVPSVVDHKNGLPEFLLTGAETSPVIECALGTIPIATTKELAKYNRLWVFALDCPPNERHKPSIAIDGYLPKESFESASGSLNRYDRF